MATLPRKCSVDNMENPTSLPHAAIKCQDLLARSTLSHCGWLRRRTKFTQKKDGSFLHSFAARLGKALRFNWIQGYVVLDQGCVYFFRDEKSQKAGKSKSLCGYNRVLRAGEIPQSDATWVFKILHCHSTVSATYFSAASEREMKMWMIGFKKEMAVANEQAVQRVGLSSSLVIETQDDYDTVERELFPSDKIPEVPPRRRESEGNDSDEDYEALVDEEDTSDEHAHPVEESAHAPIRLRRSLPGLPGQIALPGLVRKETKPKFEKSLSVPEPLPKPIPRQKKHKPVKSHSLPTESLGEREPGDGDAHSDVMHTESAPKNEDQDRKHFWEGVYWYGTDKEKANQIIRNIGKSGVYLVRTHPETLEKVLVVFLNVPMKYRIQKNNNGFFLEDGSFFDSIEEMLVFYYANNLPNSKFKLQMSYNQSDT